MIQEPKIVPDRPLDRIMSSTIARWFIYFALAMPAILLPQFDYMGPNRVRYNLGWPISGMDILVGGIDDGRVLHFQPSAVLVLVAGAWTYVMSLGWRARCWAVACSDWRGAFTGAGIVSLYSVMIICFLRGGIQVVWDWRLYAMEWSALHRALTFGRTWLPCLYGLGAAAIFVPLLLDARQRRSSQRLAHVAFALCFALVLYRVSPYLRWELAQFDEMIQQAQMQQR